MGIIMMEVNNNSQLELGNRLRMFSEILILCLLFLASLFWLMNRRPRRYAPVPRLSFPILGHLPYFLKYEKVGVSKLLLKWSKECNSPIIGVDFANFRSVVLNDSKTIKQAFALPALAGRMSVRVLTVRGGDDGINRGLVTSYGASWNEQRRFSLFHLREFGFGKKSMESVIMTEAEELIAGFQVDAGKPISTLIRFNPAVVNTFWQMCAGERFAHDDPKLTVLVSAAIQQVQGSRVIGSLLFMPWFSALFPTLSGWKTYEENFRKLDNYISAYVKERMAKHEGETNDFIGVYIEEMKKCTDPNSSFYREEGRKNLLNTLGDIFTAGSETTSTTMSWLSLYLGLHAKIQDEAQAEIDRVIGQNRLPTLSDRDSMPYVEAMLEETLRLSSVVPLGVFHSALEDVTFNGIFIPKDTVIVPNIYEANHDPSVWGSDAEEFNPSRFLSSDGTKFLRNDSIVSFSPGRRVCIGEALARNTLFLFTASILQKFRIQLDPNAPRPSASPSFCGTVAGPFPHKLIFAERF